MIKRFPRKEFWVYTTSSPLGKEKVKALNDIEIKLTDSFKGYAKGRWDAENKGWTSSVLPSSVEVEHDGDSMTIHCGLSEYRDLIGMVKLAIQTGKMPHQDYIGGLSTEIMPLTSDGVFCLEKRIKGTEHGVGFWDIPSASQTAQMWIDKLPQEHKGLVQGLFDMDGFPRWSLIRNMAFLPNEIGKIFYTGFAKGREVSLDMQYNGFTKVDLESGVIAERLKEKGKNILFYRFEDLSKVLDSIGKDGDRGERVMEDISGNVPTSNVQTNGFAIVDDCLGTLLSNTLHLRGAKEYGEALEVLGKRGYSVNLVPHGRTVLRDLY